MRYKSCTSKTRTVPTDDVEQKVLDEIFRVLRTPEVVIDLNSLIEKDQKEEPERKAFKNNVIAALKNLTEVWNYLYPAEHFKIAQMLIDEVSISDKWLTIKMNMSSFDQMLQELAA